jgi:hypothetical protein
VVGNGESADLKWVETLKFDNATYDVATHTALITTVSVADAATVKEGDGHSLDYTFTRTGDLSHALDVYYGVDGTAIAGSDFTGATGVVHFAANSDTAVLSLAVTNDTSIESAEGVGIHLLANTHYDFGAQANATGTILDNDTLPTLHISNASAVEGGNLVFHVTIDQPTDHAITFQAFTDTGTHTATPGGPPPSINFGTATAGNLPGGDYDGFPQTTYTIAAGQTSVDVSVHTRPDSSTEPTETMSLRLTNATGAVIEAGIGTGRGVGTIIDNPPVPTTYVSFYADANAVTEGQDLAFHFHRDITSSALDVKYWMGTLPAGGATPGVDFTADNTTFTFVASGGSGDFVAGHDHWADPSMFVHLDAGQSDTTLVLHTVDDHVTEGGEGFALQFDFAANGPNVQYDGAASNAAYLAAFPTADPTQVNIGHIVDHIA